MEDVTVTVGNTEVPAKLINDITYVSLRPLVEAIKKELTVPWTEKDGAGVQL